MTRKTTRSPKHRPLGSDWYFQTLDRVHVASRYLQEVFEDDPVLRRHRDLRKLYVGSVELLERLYQRVGEEAPRDARLGAKRRP